MSVPARLGLRKVIRERYDYLVSRLSNRLGSRDLAEDALHDAFVRLERAEVAGEVRQPTAYILRMASNLAANRRRKDQRLTLADAREALNIVDESADPGRDAEIASQMALVRQAMQSLPERRRKLVTEAWLDEISVAELAVRHGIAVRTVQHELKLALEQLQRVVSARGENPLRRSGREVS